MKKKTYEIVAGPRAQSFDEYSDRIMSELGILLDADTSEPVMQRFLEDNPCLVPGMRSLGLHRSAFPLGGLLISQPLLSGLGGKKPDFMWISQDSIATYPTLIEIERPTKRLFTGAGVPSADFTQARHQLAEWKAWFSRPQNVLKFLDDYAVFSLREAIKPRYILLYGRRAEFEINIELGRERGQLLDGVVEHLISYDRLAPDPLLRNVITVSVSSVGKYRAIGLPPTFELGPVHADQLAIVSDLETVLQRSTVISPERLLSTGPAALLAALG